MEEIPVTNKPQKAPEKNPVATVVIINLVVLIIYTVWAKATDTNNDAGLLLAFLITAQFLVNLFSGIVLIFFRSKEDYARGCFLSSLVMLLVGFSTCYLVSTIR
jgi:hypothetical protein